MANLPNTIDAETARDFALRSAHGQGKEFSSKGVTLASLE